MGKNTNISWAHHTSNPFIGCTKVSAECKFCYMYRMEDRYKRDPKVVRKASGSSWANVIKQALPGERIFMCSLSDFWHEAADPWREEVWNVMRTRPDVIFLFPTKRPENIMARLPHDWGRNGWPNVWLGFSAGEQHTFAKRYAIMKDIPCAVLWVSAEPMLEAIDMTKVAVNGQEVNALNGDGHHRALDWVVMGGESGNDNGPWRYRECHTKWMLDIVDACIGNEVPVFVKQMGTYLAKKLKLKDRHGTDISEFPEGLGYQQFPVSHYTVKGIMDNAIAGTFKQAE